MKHSFFSAHKNELVILAITALVLSRTMFFFFDDPEGPNLLIVMVVAVMTYLPSLAVYSFRTLATGAKKFWLAMSIQILVIVGLYVLGVTL